MLSKCCSFENNFGAKNSNKLDKLILKMWHCVVPENVHPSPTEGIGNSGEEGGS